MKCKKCLSEWKSNIIMEKCPFCGADLKGEINLKEITTISQALNYLITKYGNDILLKPRVLISYVDDLIMGQDRAKKLFRKGCDEGVLEKVYAILMEPQKNRQEIMVLDLKCSLIENSFFSNQSTIELLQIILEGVGLPQYVAIISKNSTDSTNPQSAKQQSASSSLSQKNVRIGDRIHFGKYPQGANGEMQPIEWRVLTVENGRALLIADKLIDCVKYNETYSNVTWETCTLRKWMNWVFLNKAFSSSEQSIIATVTNQNPDNPEFGTQGGSATQDRIFALSIEEANQYFRNDGDRMAAPTGYAKKQGAYFSGEYSLASGEKTGFWWLRSPGSSRRSAAFVSNDGDILQGGLYVDGGRVAVRPAFWLNL